MPLPTVTTTVVLRALPKLGGVWAFRRQTPLSLKALGPVEVVDLITAGLTDRPPVFEPGGAGVSLSEAEWDRVSVARSMRLMPKSRGTQDRMVGAMLKKRLLMDKQDAAQRHLFSAAGRKGVQDRDEALADMAAADETVRQNADG